MNIYKIRQETAELGWQYITFVNEERKAILMYVVRKWKGTPLRPFKNTFVSLFRGRDT